MVHVERNTTTELKVWVSELRQAFTQIALVFFIVSIE